MHSADGASMLGPAAGAADGLLNTLGLSSGQSIQIPSSSADLPHYEVMTGGTYTAYGLNLQTIGSPAAGSPNALVVTATDLLAAAEAESAAQPVNPMPLVSAIEDTRGLLDRLGL